MALNTRSKNENRRRKGARKIKERGGRFSTEARQRRKKKIRGGHTTALDTRRIKTKTKKRRKKEEERRTRCHLHTKTITFNSH